MDSLYFQVLYLYLPTHCRRPALLSSVPFDRQLITSSNKRSRGQQSACYRRLDRHCRQKLRMFFSPRFCEGVCMPSPPILWAALGIMFSICSSVCAYVRTCPCGRIRRAACRRLTTSNNLRCGPGSSKDKSTIVLYPSELYLSLRSEMDVGPFFHPTEPNPRC